MSYLKLVRMLAWTVIALVCALITCLVYADPITTPMVAGCPSPLPPQWPSSACAYQWYPLTDTTHAIVSVSKTAPIYQHTYSIYTAVDPVLACPAGAEVSGKSCTIGGKDASVIVPKRAVASLGLPPPPPAPVPADYTVTVNGVSDPNVAATFKALDSLQTQCFTIKSGNKSAQVCL